MPVEREMRSEMNTQGAYAGLRVLDLGQGVAAPYCAMLLAMHGAEVVKLEPLAGDWSRGLGMRYGDQTAMSAHYNRGKRSLALDLKAQAGREIALSLASRADVVIEGFRPAVAGRLGLGYDELRARNPRLLYVSVSGFGQEGPYVGLPCTDSVAQAFSGLMSVNLGNDGGAAPDRGDHRRHADRALCGAGPGCRALRPRAPRRGAVSRGQSDAMRRG